MPLIAQTRERYVRSARLRARDGGGATLWAIAWEGPYEGGVERVLAWDLDAEGAPEGDPREVERARAIPDIVLQDTGEAYATDVPNTEDEAREGDWIAHIARAG